MWLDSWSYTRRKPVKYSAPCVVFVTWSLIHLPQVSKMTAVTRAGEGMRPSGHAGVWWWQQFFQFPDLKGKSIEDGKVIRKILPMYLSYNPSSCGCYAGHTLVQVKAPMTCSHAQILMPLANAYYGLKKSRWLCIWGVFSRWRWSWKLWLVLVVMLRGFFNNSLVAWCILT